MSPDHATATTQARPAGRAFIDPWLRMRLAPVRARRPDFGGAQVRAELRKIASTRPDPAALALGLRRVRALLDRERGRLREQLADGASADKIAQAEARLLDGTVSGLCDLGRALEPRSAGVAAPLAAVARGDYGRRQLAAEASADLLFLVAADPLPRAQGLAIAQFVARELAGLGWRASLAKRTVRGCLAETLLDPAVALDLAAARLVWGDRDLFAQLRTGIAQARREPAAA